MTEPISIVGIAVRKDKNKYSGESSSSNDDLLREFKDSSSAWNIMGGFCVETNASYFLVFECLSTNFSSILISTERLFRKSGYSDSSIIFSIDDSMKNLFTEFHVFREILSEDSLEESGEGDSTAEVTDISTQECLKFPKASLVHHFET